MLQGVLTVLLAATQLLCGNAFALFVCLDSDGAVCFDGGPSACDCCHEEHGGHAHHRADIADCCSHSDGLAEKSSTTRTCDCVHVSVGQGNNLVLRTRTVARWTDFLPLALMTTSSAMHAASLKARAELSVICGTHNVDAATQLLSTVVLRC